MAGPLSDATWPTPAEPRDADAEVLLRQALRAQVGGPKNSASKAGASGATVLGRLTTAQILLIAALLGAVAGIAAALVVTLAG